MSDDEPSAYICASLGSLMVEVSGEDQEEVEERFERIWESRLEETHQMSEAITALTRGFE